MAFTFKVRLPQYRNASDITVCIYERGESVRMNGDADDTMADTASDGLFLATIDEELVGDFEYEVFRSGTTIQTGVFYRATDQAIVIADDASDAGPSPEEIGEYLEREDGLIQSIKNIFVGIDKIAKWLRQ